MNATASKFVGLSLGLLCAGAAAAQSTDEDDLALIYGDKSFVSIATGAPTPARLAPAVATVITAADIQALGATDLDEVLETVPGLHVARSTQVNGPVYTIRGIHRDSNAQVLMLVNGVPLTTSFWGNRGNAWGGLPLENVARIEVIRGPGSALYGADAFSGVINIITKSAADIGGTQLGLRAASFNSRDAWLLHGGKLGALDVAAYLRTGTTDGVRRTVAADAQTGFDTLFGTHVSHAPGATNNSRDSIDGSLDLSYGKWQFRAGYQERSNMGVNTGIASALDPRGRQYTERTTADLSYRDANIAPHWDVSLQASYLHYKELSNNLALFPAGAFGGAFADGMIGNPDKWERHGRINASAFYTGFTDHRLRLGIGANRDAIYKTRETKNFNPDFSPIGSGSFADITDVSDTVVFLKPHSRTVRYWFAQDEWRFAQDWTLTAGLRHDAYSDVGATTNPRLALAWEAAYNLTARLLYGSAFRAPSFVELYVINNPVAIGSPSIAPEKMQTLEAAVSWQAAPTLQLGANLFRYEMRDIIQIVGINYQNTGKQKGIGMELEAAWDATRELRVAGHYSHQRSTDAATQQDAGLAPHHRLYLRTDWRFTPGWAANAQLNAVGKRQRAAGDPRTDLRGYATLDLTLRTDQGKRGWQFAAAVRNLLDADVREPSPGDFAPAHPFVSIPNDFPLPGRWFWLQAIYGL